MVSCFATRALSLPNIFECSRRALVNWTASSEHFARETLSSCSTCSKAGFCSTGAWMRSMVCNRICLQIVARRLAASSFITANDAVMSLVLWSWLRLISGKLSRPACALLSGGGAAPTTGGGGVTDGAVDGRPPIGKVCVGRLLGRAGLEFALGLLGKRKGCIGRALLPCGDTDGEGETSVPGRDGGFRCCLWLGIDRARGRGTSLKTWPRLAFILWSVACHSKPVGGLGRLRAWPDQTSSITLSSSGAAGGVHVFHLFRHQAGLLVGTGTTM